MKPERTLRAGVLAMLLAGCAASQTFAPGTEPTFMTRRETAFYLYGPMQPGRPEVLQPQTFFKLLGRGPGYSHIQLEDGRTGYVADQDIKPAPPVGGAVSSDELFPPPPRVPDPPLPEPDLQMPVDEVPQEPAR